MRNEIILSDSHVSSHFLGSRREWPLVPPSRCSQAASRTTYTASSKPSLSLCRLSSTLVSFSLTYLIMSSQSSISRFIPNPKTVAVSTALLEHARLGLNATLHAIDSRLPLQVSTTFA